MTLFNIRTWADVRALIHLVAPAVSALLIANGIADENLVTQILTVVLAVFSPALAAANTLSGFRTYFYLVLGAVSTALVALNVFTESTWSLWLPIIVLLVGPAVAVANTPTTIDEDGFLVDHTEEHPRPGEVTFSDPERE